MMGSPSEGEWRSMIWALVAIGVLAGFSVTKLAEYAHDHISIHISWH